MNLYLILFLVYYTVCLSMGVYCWVRYLIKYPKIVKEINSINDNYFREDGSIIESRKRQFDNKDNYLKEAKTYILTLFCRAVIIGSIKMVFVLPIYILRFIVYCFKTLFECIGNLIDGLCSKIK